MRRASRKRLHQYTVRFVPPEVDRALRERARAAGASLNTVLVDALAAGVGIGRVARVRTDLDSFIGTWVEDPAFDAAIAAQDTIDEEAWR
jgi:hypothetical protein